MASTGRPGGAQSGVLAGTATAVAVSAKSGTSVDVSINGVIRTIQAARDLSIGIGDVVVVHRFGGLWAASARLGTGAVSEMPPAIASIDPNPTTVTGVLTVLPESTGTYLSGAWSADTAVRQGTYGAFGNATGAIFYGTKARSLAGATVTSARIEQVRRTAGPSPLTGSTMRLVTESSRPVGAPTLTSTTSGPITQLNYGNIAFSIPISWAQAFVDGTSGGLGFYDADGDPYLSFVGRADNPAAFALAIDWTRTL